MPPPSLPGSSGPISILALETRTDVLLALAIKRQSSSCLTLHPFGHVLNLGEFGLDWPTDRTKEASYVVSVVGSYVRLKKKRGKDASEIAAKLDVLERALIAQKVCPGLLSFSAPQQETDFVFACDSTPTSPPPSLRYGTPTHSRRPTLLCLRPARPSEHPARKGRRSRLKAATTTAMTTVDH